MRPVKHDISRDLVILGWSQADLAERIDVHRNTVSAWATGKAETPGPVKAYLALAIKVGALLA
jgi:transcriptional regulator with XRE-family HTH domain